MEPDVGLQILCEVRDVRKHLDAKVEDVKSEVADLRGRFDRLEAATAHGFDVVTAQVEGLRADIVRNERKRR